MNWFSHEYLFPIIIGNGSAEKEAARAIRKYTGSKPCLLAESFGIFQHTYASCRKVAPLKDHTLLMAISDLCEGLEEYRFPVLIYGRDLEKFVVDNKDAIEAMSVTVEIGQVNELLNGANKDDT